jgi:hypothetical protein
VTGEERFSAERVAGQYLRWYRSPPFDIGGTTRTGLAGGLNQPAGRVHLGMWREAERNNQGAKARNRRGKICRRRHFYEDVNALWCR